VQRTSIGAACLARDLHVELTARFDRLAIDDRDAAAREVVHPDAPLRRASAARRQRDDRDESLDRYAQRAATSHRIRAVQCGGHLVKSFLRQFNAVGANELCMGRTVAWVSRPWLQ
jgi:hypothetical protein